jgi:hypothetical protein
MPRHTREAAVLAHGGFNMTGSRRLPDDQSGATFAREDGGRLAFGRWTNHSPESSHGPNDAWSVGSD